MPTSFMHFRSSSRFLEVMYSLIMSEKAWVSASDVSLSEYPCQPVVNRSAECLAAKSFLTATQISTPSLPGAIILSTCAKKLGEITSSTMARPKNRVSILGVSGMSSVRSSVAARSLLNPIATCSSVTTSAWLTSARSELAISRSLSLLSIAIWISILTNKLWRPGSAACLSWNSTSDWSAESKYSTIMERHIDLNSFTERGCAVEPVEPCGSTSSMRPFLLPSEIQPLAAPLSSALMYISFASG
mmetsp:Transcript_503/g.1336  ORF Transcript_503/g.1336 Transcript_503/m.1336 type:complete len:245 (+) Transcript_503:283-1017(+)